MKKRVLARVMGVGIAALATRTPALSYAQNVVKITGVNYVFIAPDTIPAGLTIFEFTNTATDAHEALLKRVPDGMNVRDVMAAFNAGKNLDNLEQAGGPDILDPHTSARTMQMIKPGTYIWQCVVKSTADSLPHSRKGMIRVMVVKPVRAVTKTPEPVAKTTLHLTEFAFAFDAPLKRGAQWVRVNNDGRKPHEVVIFKLLPGKTLDDVKAWQRLRDPNAPQPFTRIGGLATIAAGDHAYIWFNGAPGGYILRCRITDSETMKTHTQLGMQSEIHVD